MARDTVVPAKDQASYDNFHFAPAVRAKNGLLFCSGQIGLKGRGVPEGVEEEFHLAWQAVGAILEEAGLGFDDVIEITTYHVGLQEHMGTFMKVKDEYISEPYSAWTAIGITELAVPGARVEIRVVAG